MASPEGLLLDTHAFVWALSAPDRIGRRLRLWLGDAARTPLVSVVSFWELSLLVRRGRMEFSDASLPEFIADGIAKLNATTLPLRVDHILTFHRLPEHHKDLFDRMLVAQAVSEGAALATRDETIRRNYAVQVLW